MNQEEHQKLSRELRMVGKAIPDYMKQGSVRTIKPMEEQKYKLEEALRRNPSSFPKELRKNLLESIDRGDYDKTKQVIDHRYDKTMNEIADVKVKEIIERRGGLEKVRREVAQDPFIIENELRIKNEGIK